MICSRHNASSPFLSSLVWRTKWSDSRKLWSISQLPPNHARPTWGPPLSSVSSKLIWKHVNKTEPTICGLLKAYFKKKKLIYILFFCLCLHSTWVWTQSIWGTTWPHGTDAAWKESGRFLSLGIRRSLSHVRNSFSALHESTCSRVD